ncbi:MAG: hypothetical protein JST70_14040 [Bacteroidetes bacterium]|nr:hypothetical protein [Bacteroidota bacterium]
MNKEELRPIIAGRFHPENGFFHKWVTKVYSDEPGCEHVYALVEFENGTIKSVPAEEIRFIDRN